MLRTQSVKFREDAIAAATAASDYTQRQDLDRAQSEQRRADDANKEAQRLEDDILILSRTLEDKQKELEALEAEEATVKADLEQKLSDIQKRKTNLYGTSAGFF